MILPSSPSRCETLPPLQHLEEVGSIEPDGSDGHLLRDAPGDRGIGSVIAPGGAVRGECALGAADPCGDNAQGDGDLDAEGGACSLGVADPLGHLVTAIDIPDTTAIQTVMIQGVGVISTLEL